jgi:predicted lactoylglutathione lyase
MRMIFVNLPVKDVRASTAFFSELGFEFNPQYCDDDAACMIVDHNIYVMLLVEHRFKNFINGEIADTATTTEAINCLSADSRKQIDETIAKAIAAGGRAWMPAMEIGPMYGGSFQDLDGHVWELMHMGEHEG